MSNEIKVALLAIVTLALTFWGYKFVIGKNLLTRSNVYYVEYDNVDLLKISTPVTINGVQVGFVSSIKPDIERNIVVVSLDLEKDLDIPKNTIAEIKAEGFMGGKSVRLVFDGPCSGPDCAKSGDYIKGRTLGMMASFLSPDEMDQYMKTLKKGLQEVVDTLNHQLLDKDAQGPLAESLRNLQGTLAHLNSSTTQLDQMLSRSSGDISGSLRNLSSITKNIEASNAKIASLINNAEKFSGQLDQVNLKKTMTELDQTLTELKTTINTADKTFAGINGVVSDIKAGKGSLGKLLSEDSLYQDINFLSQRADSLIEDIHSRPYRYIPLKSRSKVKRYDLKDKQEVKN